MNFLAYRIWGKLKGDNEHNTSRRDHCTGFILSYYGIFFNSNSACIQLAEKQVLGNKILESCEKMTDMIEHCRLGENRVG